MILETALMGTDRVFEDTSVAIGLRLVIKSDNRYRFEKLLNGRVEMISEGRLPIEFNLPSDKLSQFVAVYEIKHGPGLRSIVTEAKRRRRRYEVRVVLAYTSLDGPCPLDAPLLTTDDVVEAKQFADSKRMDYCHGLAIVDLIASTVATIDHTISAAQRDRLGVDSMALIPQYFELT